MARMESGGTHHEEKIRLELHLSPDSELHAPVAEMLEEQDISKSDLLRAALDELVDTQNDGSYINWPDDETERKTLKLLQNVSDEDGRIKRDVAHSIVAQTHSQSIDSVRLAYIKPLIDAGYVREKVSIGPGDGVYDVITEEDARKRAEQLIADTPEANA